MSQSLRLVLLLCPLAACAGHAKRSDSYGARKALAQEMVRRADWERAFPVVNGLHREDSDDAEVLALRGVIYREQRLGAEAEADLLDALSKNPRLAGAHAAIAILYEGQGKGEEALQHHRAALDLDATNAGYANNMGFALLARGRARDAIPVLQQALRLDPTNRRIRNNLGLAYGKIGEFGRAAEQFAMGGGPAEAKHNLAFVYHRAGNLAQAFDLYVEALRLDPGLKTARKNLEEVARRLQRKVPADLPGDSLS